MTVEELYEYCKERNIENYPIYLDCVPEDTYYTWGKYLEKEHIDCGKLCFSDDNMENTSLILRADFYNRKEVDYWND